MTGDTSKVEVSDRMGSLVAFVSHDDPTALGADTVRLRVGQHELPPIELALLLRVARALEALG